MIDLENIDKEYGNILEQLSDPELISNWPASNASPARMTRVSVSGGRSDAGWGKFEELSKRKKELEKIMEKGKEIEKTKQQIQENKAIISAREDAELISLAEGELSALAEKEKSLEREIENLIKGGGKAEPKAVIVEIRAGAGGEEASLFAKDLFRMYSKYAQLCGWQQKTLDSHSTELGGLKEIVFELTPHHFSEKSGGERDVFSKMKYEGGVHRVQRIPETEKSGRTHTSTVSVAVLPKAKSAQIKIRPDDLKVDFYRASGPGGQYVNKRETAVRITHLPTGLVVTSQTERNQLKNKENALAILEVRLLEKEQQEKEERVKGERKSQIGSAKRAEKIRTYNFPQDRITDHRIKKSWHNIAKIMEGEMDLMINALQKSEVS